MIDPLATLICLFTKNSNSSDLMSYLVYHPSFGAGLSYKRTDEAPQRSSQYGLPSTVLTLLGGIIWIISVGENEFPDPIRMSVFVARTVCDALFWPGASG